MPPSTSSITITNPLTLYRSYLATSRLLPDPHQHRVALLLEPVYERLHSYTPPAELDTRLRVLTRTLYKPLKSHRTPIISVLQDRRDLALVRNLSTAESALTAPSPKGFFLHGEVGTGKSLLLDLLYHSLPHAGKARWHFHAFMLSLYAQLHQSSASPSLLPDAQEHTLLRLARQLVVDSPILFLDEIQFPDRASAKIVSELLIRFWSFGGVLVGSSNRAPATLPEGVGVKRGEKEFRGFEEAVSVRCEDCMILGSRDWRRERREGWWRVGAEYYPRDEVDSAGEEGRYWFSGGSHSPRFEAALAAALGTTNPAWRSQHITVYGRTVAIPKLYNGVAVYTFAELCTAELGPADYLSLCATFHTLFITNVPALSHAWNKNGARRFITLLDAVYESGVRLAVSTTDQISIDDLLFADLQAKVNPSNNNTTGSNIGSSSSGGVGGGGEAAKHGETDITGDSDSLYGEVFSESTVDVGFRPNVATSNEGFKETIEAIPSQALDFTKTAAFTGVDEIFAARRAVSRIWETTGKGWWSGVVWRPMGRERCEVEKVVIDQKVEVVGVETHPQAPVFGERHFWSLGLWGKRAGTWGKGVEGLGEKK